ncbi:MAG: hypothetical protein JOZ57_10000 [Abitibacteriaceae bacterium]|nr:hypothetical protein [Abditibacteriaceae bacterium]
MKTPKPTPQERKLDTVAASPLARALALVEARDATAGQATPRIQDVNDAAAEIRQMRATRTP